jgi:hypothetical protein
MEKNHAVRFAATRAFGAATETVMEPLSLNLQTFM